MSETPFRAESDSEAEHRGKDPDGVARVMGADRGQTTLDFAIGISVFLITVAFVLAFIPGMLQPFTGGLEEETVAVNRVADSLSQGMLGDPAEPNTLDRECTVIFFENQDDSSLDSGGDDGENRNGDGVYSDPFGGGTSSIDCNFEDNPLAQRLGIEGRNSASLNVRVSIVRDLTTEESDNPDADSDDCNPGEGCDDGTDQDGTGVKPLCFDPDEDIIIEGDTPETTGTKCDLPGGDDDVYFRTGGTPPSDSGSVVVARRVVNIEGGMADGTTEATLVVEMW